ncbi:1-acyl-sn-glycerol-3-phosphate acyltransferase [Streptomyces sp. XD-27]|uniref:lysophospholipid acyltransferase family protein n=1 Tax=Streptomyces sp. XD-27 TaxID=3062779 RepID=UPI0026F4629E|nr:lysophospholipid acyltransferase family protein [Streptomyces sp. XD-27]WKX72727.1 lysophospholipid acyltransferase family protein [Streptomyces sp. XD-27]
MNTWGPWSPCTPGCAAPAAPPVPAAVAWRRTGALARTVAGALLRGGRIAEPAVLRSRAQAVLDALDVRLDVRMSGRPEWQGGPATVPGGSGPLTVPGRGGTLVVANHISWLDVIALLAVEPVTMLAKRQVADWPVVGPLTRRAGTLFIDRDSLRSLPGTVDRMSGLLRDGRSVMVFPQGVTWCAGTGGTFRRATFQAALDAGAPIRPVTLDYLQHRGPTTVAAFVGDDDFATSLRRVNRAAGLTVRVTVHPPLLPAPGDDRRALAARARAAVAGVRAAVAAPDHPASHHPASHHPASRHRASDHPASDPPVTDRQTPPIRPPHPAMLTACAPCTPCWWGSTTIRSSPWAAASTM